MGIGAASASSSSCRGRTKCVWPRHPKGHGRSKSAEARFVGGCPCPACNFSTRAIVKTSQGWRSTTSPTSRTVPYHHVGAVARRAAKRGARPWPTPRTPSGIDIKVVQWLRYGGGGSDMVGPRRAECSWSVLAKMRAVRDKSIRSDGLITNSRAALSTKSGLYRPSHAGLLAALRHADHSAGRNTRSPIMQLHRPPRQLSRTEASGPLITLPGAGWDRTSRPCARTSARRSSPAPSAARVRSFDALDERLAVEHRHAAQGQLERGACCAAISASHAKVQCRGRREFGEASRSVRLRRFSISASSLRGAVLPPRQLRGASEVEAWFRRGRRSRAPRLAASRERSGSAACHSYGPSNRCPDIRAQDSQKSRITTRRSSG